MSSNTQGSPQGYNGPTQPAQYPYGSGGTTQYGGFPPNPYGVGVPPPPPRFPKRTNRWLILLIVVLIFVVVLSVSGFVWAITRSPATAGTSSTPTTTVPSSTASVQPTTAQTQLVSSPITPTPVVTQPPDPTKQGKAISSNQTDPPYTTPNGTVICSGDVSVAEPNGTTHHPDSDPTTGEVVAITGSGYTITFTNSASCIQYPSLTRDQASAILAGLEAQQKSSGCVNNAGCTGPEQVWIFP